MTERKAQTGDKVVYKTLTREVVDHDPESCACQIGEECKPAYLVRLKGIRDCGGWVREELVTVIPDGDRLR